MSQHVIRRITTEPNTPLRVLVDHQTDPADGGFLGGGSFFFAPAGQDGDRHNATGHAARVIMGDPGLAVHFECTPPVDAPAVAPAAAPEPATAEPVEPAQKQPAGRKRAGGKPGTEK